MKIENAIKILELELHSAVTLSTHNSKDAIKLGIEALERVLDVRRFPDASNWKPLPGETE